MFVCDEWDVELGRNARDALCWRSERWREYHSGPQRIIPRGWCSGNAVGSRSNVPGLNICRVTLTGEIVISLGEFRVSALK